MKYRPFGKFTVPRQVPLTSAAKIIAAAAASS
jgi:hypothetical protein